MQSSSRVQPFKLVLAGASPATDTILLSRCNQSCTPLCEGGGSWCKSTWEHHFASVPQQPQERFRKPLFVGASPTRDSNFNGDHDVTAASRPVKAFVPVRIRLVTPISDFEPVSSISRSSLEWFYITLVQFAVRFRN